MSPSYYYYTYTANDDYFYFIALDNDYYFSFIARALFSKPSLSVSAFITVKINSIISHAVTCLNFNFIFDIDFRCLRYRRSRRLNTLSRILFIYYLLRPRAYRLICIYYLELMPQ